MQLFTIVVSRGDMILLGEAYAFGVVWSFVFKTLSMVVLRFKDRSHREFMVPFNLKWGNVQLPIGLFIVFLIMLLSALANLVTKPVATVSGLIFTAIFLAVFVVTERYYHKRRGGAHHEHLEQFNRSHSPQVTAESLGLVKPYRKLVAIRSPHNLFMLDKALADTDPKTTDVVVMTAKVELPGSGMESIHSLDVYDQHLLTAVVNHAEKLGKTVTPLLVPTNNALNALLQIARDLPAQEVVVGASNKYSAEEQLDQIALYWINLHDGEPHGLTVHVVSSDRDLTFDLHEGNRIPKTAERKAKTVADLRAAGIGTRRVLLAHDGTTGSHDIFDWVLTMIASDVALDLVPVAPSELNPLTARDNLQKDQQRAAQLGHSVSLLATTPQSGPDIVRLAAAGGYDIIVLPLPMTNRTPLTSGDDWLSYVRQHAPVQRVPGLSSGDSTRSRGNVVEGQGPRVENLEPRKCKTASHWNLHVSALSLSPSLSSPPPTSAAPSLNTARLTLIVSACSQISCQRARERGNHIVRHRRCGGACAGRRFAAANRGTFQP